MSKLVPQQRVDRNGKTVTRHMRNEDDVSKAAPKIPVPSVVSYPYDKSTTIDHFFAIISERGAETGNLNTLSGSISAISEGTRDMVMEALESDPRIAPSLNLVSAVHTGDEGYMRVISGNLPYFSSITTALLGCTSSRKSLEAVCKDMESVYFRMFSSPPKSRNKILKPGEEFDDELMGSVFKATYLAERMNTERATKLKYEMHQHIQALKDNEALIEPALPAIIYTKTAMRHWATENRESNDAMALDSNDAIAIAKIMRDYPDAADKIYNIVVERGSFNQNVVREALNSGASSLSRGHL